MREVNVAIADDNERILDMLGEIIEQDQDLNLIGKADNGEDIYHLIKEKKPDVVLLDLIMPKMDGLSVMEKVNMDEQITKRPEFIIVTAVGQERITEDAFRKGASYYVKKPYDLKQDQRCGKRGEKEQFGIRKPECSFQKARI